MKLLITNQFPVRFVSDAHAAGNGEFTINAVLGSDLSRYTPDIITNQLAPKEAALYRIKLQSREMIEALDWRTERAKERDQIGAEGETVADVMREREAIRRASNRAEAFIANTTDDEPGLRRYELSVLPSDYPESMVLTRLGFLQRFTDVERKTIRSARDTGENQNLLDFWELLQVADHVNLRREETRQGVQMLEAEGLINDGRASDILAVSESQ